MAISRKDFIGALTGRAPRERCAGTLAALAHGVERGAHIFRVHDVAAAADFLTVRAALAGELPPSRDLALAEEMRYDRLRALARRAPTTLQPLGSAHHGCPPLSNAAGRQPPLHNERRNTMAVLERSELEASPLADLHAIADQLGLDGFRRLRKADLIDAILGEEPAPTARTPTTSEGEEEAARAGAARRAAPPRPRRGGRDDEPPTAKAGADGEARAPAASGRESRTRRGAPAAAQRRAAAAASAARSAREERRDDAEDWRSTRRASPRASSRCWATARPSCASTRPSPPTTTSTSPPRRCAAASWSPATA